MKIYAENKHKIAKHNQRYELGQEKYKLGVNKYSDMLHHEFVNTMNGFNKTLARYGCFKKRGFIGIIIDGHNFFP